MQSVSRWDHSHHIGREHTPGGSPYGASIVAGTMQKPKAVSENEKEIGRYQGKFVAETADALVRGRALQKK